MPDEWTEVNLVLFSQNDATKVLLDVIDPLVHDELSGQIDSWHYGQYEEEETPLHLRLRIRWRDPERAAEGRGIISDYLGGKKYGGILQDFYEGSHGKRGQTYPDETDKFKEMWDASYRFWESQSEYTLALLKHQSDGLLTEDLTWHWESTAHLFSNRLLLNSVDEVYLGLQRARAYTNPQSDIGHALAQIQLDIGRPQQGTRDRSEIATV